MTYRPNNDAERRKILARTHGRCHLCRKQLCVNNYGKLGRRGAWEVDHSLAQARGGTHHGNNLLGACISCNRSKRDGCSRAYRKGKGLMVRPSSTAARERNRSRNAFGWGAAGAACGLPFGPAGILLFGSLGLFLGDALDPD